MVKIVPIVIGWDRHGRDIVRYSVREGSHLLSTRLFVTRDDALEFLKAREADR